MKLRLIQTDTESAERLHDGLREIGEALEAQQADNKSAYVKYAMQCAAREIAKRMKDGLSLNSPGEIDDTKRADSTTISDDGDPGTMNEKYEYNGREYLSTDEWEKDYWKRYRAAASIMNFKKQQAAIEAMQPEYAALDDAKQALAAMKDKANKGGAESGADADKERDEKPIREPVEGNVPEFKTEKLDTKRVPLDNITRTAFSGAPYNKDIPVLVGKGHGRKKMRISSTLRLGVSQSTPPLDSVDIAIYSAISDLWMRKTIAAGMEGKKDTAIYTTAEEIYNQMVGSARRIKLLPKKKQEIISRIDKMSTIRAYVNTKEEQKNGYSVRSDSYHSQLLMSSIETAKANRKVIKDAIRIAEQPILSQYSCDRGNILTYNIADNNPPVSNTWDALIIKLNITMRIYQFNTTMGAKILCQTLIDLLPEINQDDGTPQWKNRYYKRVHDARNTIIKIMDYYKDPEQSGLIDDYDKEYELYGKKQILRAVTFKPSKKLKEIKGIKDEEEKQDQKEKES